MQNFAGRFLSDRVGCQPAMPLQSKSLDAPGTGLGNFSELKVENYFKDQVKSSLIINFAAKVAE